MLQLRLPDGSVKEVPAGSRPRDVVEQIGKRLAKAAVAAKFDDMIIDLDREFPASEGIHDFAVLTDKDPDALAVLRHSCAHVMARAILRLYPGAKLAFGPATESGFYYDVDVSPPISEEDLPKIEEEMRRIVERGEPFERFEEPTDEGRALCLDLGQDYKVEHIDESLREFPTLSFYRQGNFIDLCRGPHLPDAGRIGAFKLLNVAGAYWKNDASRKQLQRVYGTAFFSKKDLEAYLEQIEEAKKRDHRVLGKQLRLFTISPAVGSGLILWMPKGATIRGVLETFIKDELIKRGYRPVYTPHIGRLELYRTSGHFPYYRDAQYPPMWIHPLGQSIDTWHELLTAGELTREQEDGFLHMVRAFLDAEHGGEAASLHHLIDAYRDAESDEQRKAALQQWLEQEEGYLLKPMNCPHHIQIYKAEQHSYRDLPIRLAEFGTVYRYEQTGELSGMTRVRGFTQDDAHLFVTPEQIEDEMRANIELVLFVLGSLGLDDYRVRVGLRDPNSDKYVGSDEDWKNAEQSLIEIVRNLGMNYSAEQGEAAFYGPKIDFVVRDCIGREWQLGTVQLDYNLPKRFELEYVGADNQPHRPVMIHRAPFGSMERFVGILIEHFAGAFPLWLAPEQVRVLTISERHTDYGQHVAKQLEMAGIRVGSDFSAEKIGHKIRAAQLEKIPYMVVIGEKERENQTVAVRDRVEGDLGAMPLAEFLDMLRKEIEEKRIRQVVKSRVPLGEGKSRFAD